MERCSNMGWRYDYLLSCPAVLLLGFPRYKSFEAVATLTLLYPRVSILRRGDEEVVVGDIPSVLNGDRVTRICKSLSQGVFPSDGFLDKVIAYAMYMGGFNIFINHDGEPVIVTSEVVDDKNIYMYYSRKPVTAKGFKDTGLDEWVMFGVALRLGDYKLLLEQCRDLGLVRDNTCFITSGSIEVVLSSKKLSNDDYNKLVVDNNGLRNVIKVND